MRFSEWLSTHRDHFRDYNAWEIARLALACGFTMAEIAPTASGWVTASRRKLLLWDNPLMQQWVEIWAYQRSGQEWDSI